LSNTSAVVASVVAGTGIVVVAQFRVLLRIGNTLVALARLAEWAACASATGLSLRTADSATGSANTEQATTTLLSVAALAVIDAGTAGTSAGVLLILLLPILPLVAPLPVLLLVAPLLALLLVAPLLAPLLRRIDVVSANGGDKPREETTDNSAP
jgi:hypothetical protein